VKVEQEDKSPDFSVEKAENYYEAPITWESLNIDPKVWEEKVRKYSGIFNENGDLLDGSTYLSAILVRKIFVDTEGREIAQNSVSFQLALTAEAVADDGMHLPLYKTWMGYSLSELPPDEEVVKAAQEMSQMLSNLKKAPVVESFSGPAILSPAASGVFFHEIFGHRVEGSRLKQENDAQTFKKKIGERVLPKQLSVVFDPTMK
jgi:predicted Zn-dependent protease